MSKKVIFFLTHILYQNQTNEFALTSSMIEEFQKSECKAINCYHSIKTDIINDFFYKILLFIQFFCLLDWCSHGYLYVDEKNGAYKY